MNLRRRPIVIVALAVCAGVGAVGLWQAGAGDAPAPAVQTSAGTVSPSVTPGPHESGSVPGFGESPSPDGTLDLEVQLAGRTLSTPDELLHLSGAPDALESGMLEDVPVPDLREQGMAARALLTDGSFVVESVGAEDADLTLKQSRTGVFVGGRATLWPTVHAEGVDKDVQRQGEAADESRGVVAWVETPSTDLFTDSWSVFAHSLDGDGRTIPLASSEDLLPGELLPIKGPYIQPSVGASRVFWGSPYPRGSTVRTLDDLGVGVFAKDIDGRGELDRIADGAIYPAAVGEDVVYVRGGAYDPATPDDRFVIARRDGRGEGAEERIVSGALGETTKFSGMVATETHVAWALKAGSSEISTSRVNILDLRTGVLTAVDLESAYGVSTLRMDDDALVFASDTVRGLVRLSDMSVYRLPDGEGLWHSLLLASPYVSWQENGDGPFGVLRLARLTS